MTFPRRRSVTLLALAAALFGVPLTAQTPGARITGTVREARGAPLEAVRVTATNNATGATRSASTGTEGAYAITGLTPGAYTVTASLIGYRRIVRQDVQVVAEARTDFVLEPLPLQAVIVTATLREQELAEVPFSIAAPTSRELRERGTLARVGYLTNQPRTLGVMLGFNY